MAAISWATIAIAIVMIGLTDAAIYRTSYSSYSSPVVFSLSSSSTFVIWSSSDTQYQTMSAKTTAKIIDQNVYSNFYGHCTSSAFQMNYNERYLIYGSVPTTYGTSSPFVDTNGNPLSDYLTSTCSFTLTGPAGYKLKANFNDPKCNSWPSGCSLTVYDGARRNRVLLSLPSSSSSSSCSQQFSTSSNSLAVSVYSCTPNPNPYFNFTLSIMADVNSNITSTTAYIAFLILIVGIVAAVIIVLRCCCYRGRQVRYVCCFFPVPIRPVIYPAAMNCQETVIYAGGAPPPGVFVTGVSTMPMCQQQVVMQPNVQPIKYDQTYMMGGPMIQQMPPPPPYGFNVNNNQAYQQMQPAPPPPQPPVNHVSTAVPYPANSQPSVVAVQPDLDAFRRAGITVTTSKPPNSSAPAPSGVQQHVGPMLAVEATTTYEIAETVHSEHATSSSAVAVQSNSGRVIDSEYDSSEFPENRRHLMEPLLYGDPASGHEQPLRAIDAKNAVDKTVADHIRDKTHAVMGKADEIADKANQYASETKNEMGLAVDKVNNEVEQHWQH